MTSAPETERNPPTEELLDRVAIREVLVRYATGVDRRDWPLMESCFAADCRSTYNGQVLDDGPEAITRYIRDASTRFTVINSVHFLGHSSIDLDGDTAEAETHGVGYMVFDDGGEPALRTRGLHYVDSLRRDGGRWVISRRTLSARWERREAVTLPE